MKEKGTPKPPDKVANPSQGQGLISASHFTNVFPHLKKSTWMKLGRAGNTPRRRLQPSLDNSTLCR